MADHKSNWTPARQLCWMPCTGQAMAAYAVGGCVRDSLLALRPTIGTSAPAPARSR